MGKTLTYLQSILFFRCWQYAFLCFSGRIWTQVCTHLLYILRRRFNKLEQGHNFDCIYILHSTIRIKMLLPKYKCQFLISAQTDPEQRSRIRSRFLIRSADRINIICIWPVTCKTAGAGMLRAKLYFSFVKPGKISNVASIIIWKINICPFPSYSYGRRKVSEYF